jgi:hypothetical protein
MRIPGHAIHYMCTMAERGLESTSRECESRARVRAQGVHSQKALLESARLECTQL